MLSLNSEPIKQVYSQTVFIQVFLKSNIHPNTRLQRDLEMRIDSICPKQCSNVWNKKSYFCLSTLLLLSTFAHIIWPGTCFVAFSLLLFLYCMDAVPHSFCEGEAGLREKSLPLPWIMLKAAGLLTERVRWPTEKLIHQPSITVLNFPVLAKDQNKIVLASSLFL